MATVTRLLDGRDLTMSAGLVEKSLCPLKLAFHMYVIRHPLSDMRHLSYVKSLSIYTISPADGSFFTCGMWRRQRLPRAPSCHTRLQNTHREAIKTESYDGWRTYGKGIMTLAGMRILHDWWWVTDMKIGSRSKSHWTKTHRTISKRTKSQEDKNPGGQNPMGTKAQGDKIQVRQKAQGDKSPGGQNPTETKTHGGQYPSGQYPRGTKSQDVPKNDAFVY